MQSILTQSPQIPDRTAAVQRAIGQVPLAERFQRAPQTRVNATTNKHSDRVDLREALGEDPSPTRNTGSCATCWSWRAESPGQWSSPATSVAEDLCSTIILATSSVLESVLDPRPRPPAPLTPPQCPTQTSKLRPRPGRGMAVKSHRPSPAGRAAAEGCSTRKFRSTPRPPAPADPLSPSLSEVQLSTNKYELLAVIELAARREERR